MTRVTFSAGSTHEVRSVPPLAMRELYRRHHDEQETLERLLREVPLLIGLQGLPVPKDWQFPQALGYAGIAPREGQEGRLLDYIEYHLLATKEDLDALNQALFGEISEAEIADAEATFCPDGGGAGAAAHTAGSASSAD